MSLPKRRIDVGERGRRDLEGEDFTEELAAFVNRVYGQQVEVSASSRGGWQVQATRWVGILPLGPGHSLYIEPKVPIHNLFRMLEWAWGANFQAFEGLEELANLQDVYERLARILALRVLDRLRRGLARSYQPAADRLPYLRGRLDVPAHLRAPASLSLPCRFEEQTTDIDDNRILAWTLRVIALSGLVTERSQTVVGQAFRGLSGQADPRPFRAADCVGRAYHRLNEDYRTLHALCRFFLETSGPAHRRGQHWMIPFAVNTESLFEQFVAAWLRGRLPAGFHLASQHSLWIPGDPAVDLNPDLVLCDEADRPVAVLDTKYKAGDKVSRADLYQIHAYAAQLGCSNAFLVYPEARQQPYDVTLGRDAPVRVRSVGFDLSGDLNEAGQRFLAAILE
jgi:5-methylcytosine-specific restriction enzyme subunit McrC